MQRLSVFLFTSILGKNIYDEFDDVLGELKDIYVTTEQGYPRVIGYKVKRDGVTFHYEFRSIVFYSEDNKVKILTRGSKEILPRTYSYLLSRNLLDKKIVDINGKRVVRVDDLRIAEIAGEYRVIAVETGPLAKFRRMNCQAIGRFLYKILNKDYEDKVLMWDDVESLEMVNNNLQISVPYKKLSTLHPADLADILENLDANSRKQIFESLDEDLAADTLEEIEQEYKSSIIKDLSEAKAVEVLENMPNDEIADILDYDIDFRVMNAQELDFDDEEFDVVISRNLTWTLPDIEKAYKEWYRVLKKDGVLLNFDADYGKVSLKEEMKSLGEEHSHNMMDSSLVKECDDIKQELEISKRRRPMWDEKFLQEIGFESCKIDCEISGRVYKIKDDFYNPTPMFKVCAIKSR